MAVVKSSMKEQCYEIIKEKILRQEYELGEEINIVKLSTELSVSNTPIREALSMLEVDGLVVTSLNTKAQVVSLTPEGFKDIVQSIYVLFKGAYELCVIEERIPELLIMMEKSLKVQEDLLGKGDYYKFIQELIYYDQIIFEALDNPHLLYLFERLSNILFLMFRTNYQRDDWDYSRSIDEHRRIYEAIKKGDHKEVEGLFYEHYHQSFIDKN
jgi:DNA-binding GntR family transcriptional regulator